MCPCVCVRVSMCIGTYACMCVASYMSTCIHVCHHVHTFVFATHLPVLDSVPVRAPCQNKRLTPGKSDMWTICLCGVQADLCVFLYVSVCVSPNVACLLGLIWGSTGGISGFCHPHMCVSAAMAVIETVGIVCFRPPHENWVCVCVRERARERESERVMTGDTKFCQQTMASRPGQSP